MSVQDAESLAEDISWRRQNIRHSGLGRVGVSRGEGNLIAFALETTLANIRKLPREPAGWTTASGIASRVKK